jgi:hypothetical protein
LPKSFDPYLRYAIATDFETFESFDEKTFRLFFLVEFRRPGLATSFERRMKEAGFEVEFGPYDDDSRYVTLRTGTAAVTDPHAYRIWNDFVSRVELSLPLKLSAGPLTPGPRRHRWDEGKDRAEPGSTLIGVIDDGCPFAAAHFLRSPASTRVRGIWDQNDDPRDPIPVGAEFFGEYPTDFTYGLEFRRDYAAIPSPIGLDDWIALHSIAGTIDEDGCYADGGFKSLSRRQSHGAHVTDVLAGRVPPSSRVGPSPGDRRDPPSWKLGTDIPSDSDIVFVQFSDACIRDATGVWLKAYVCDGIEYILSYADPTNTKKVVINVSYGPTTGPHDGTALLEAALTAFVTKYNGTSGKPKLEIVLPAGNSYLSEGHIAYRRRSTQPDQVEWVWRLPPDNSVLCFAEVWINRASPGPVIVTLTSPSGATSTSAGGPPSPGTGVPIPPYTGVFAPYKWGSNTMWLVAVQPTRRDDDPKLAAEHGDWKIKVSGIPKNAQVHAYVARSDPNMGVRTGAKRSYFVDDDWEMAHSSAASCIYANGEFDTTGSLIHRGGTLNGIATGKDASVHVAGGFNLADGRKSPYSSAGPARGPVPPRAGPDYALLGDESYALRGVRAGGNRSGAVFRLVGTSAAAPQLARHVADPPIPPPTNVPAPPEDAKRGGGNIKPP